MRILITGSSGQIGTNVGLDLISRGDEVVGLDNRENTWTDSIPTVICDLTQTNISELNIGDNFDVVLHLAAHAKVHDLVIEPHRALENVLMLFSVLEFCRKSSIPIIFGSSREVYGDIHRHITEELHADFVVAESPYSASKISGEAFIYSYSQCYDLPYLVFRFSNVYGKCDNDIDRMERVIPLFVHKIKNDLPITVYGKDKILDFTYVDDCVSGITLGVDALVNKNISCETINLAHGHGSSLVDVVNIISLCLGKEPNVTYKDSRRGEVTRYVADISKARNLLGYETKIPISNGIPRSIAWQK